MNTVELTDEQAEDIFKLVDKIEQDEDIQKVYHNMK
jgi:transcriptional/translational regulatory protein YebC/TACO1